MAQNEDGTTDEKVGADELENTAVKGEAKASATPFDDASADKADAKNTTDSERDPEDVSLEEVQNILNQEADSRDLPKSVQKLLVHEQESTKRVEETIKNAKSNPRWFVPVFSVLLVVGLAWVVVNYITGGTYPIPGLGNWNLLIGFAIMMVGFLMTMWWN
ncbi:MAG: cell division protein CrgA [Bifidobacteriaceae bacterium]|jgi:cobalamin biosynthesis Mg chelatase CobN|nr:cell division protein CrgA [Bifidobacteriaceae bacterium]MCI1915427.1 cell division protein CrgA [Bifidobacteriaceae bacterium]